MTIVHGKRAVQAAMFFERLRDIERVALEIVAASGLSAEEVSHARRFFRAGLSAPDPAIGSTPPETVPPPEHHALRILELLLALGNTLGEPLSTGGRDIELIGIAIELQRAVEGIDFPEAHTRLERIRQRERARKAVGKPKRPASMAFRELAKVIVTADPVISARAALEAIPDAAEAGDEPNTDCGFITYRDGECIVAVDNTSGTEYAITYHGWRKYITEAKKIRQMMVVSRDTAHPP